MACLGTFLRIALLGESPAENWQAFKWGQRDGSGKVLSGISFAGLGFRV